ncbi:hypothetical protein GCM10011514_09560 [Emticicia aquatilis]|uniref:Methylmalonyl-CoA mutase alpha/beta chain catalytic domain-containing protein n=1 Tax=Emticicia aquatilis TaxID=1537369 RepID=A0A917DLR9_9BACT|nr:methylmalonyl-CoA mutase family protein [Emticicia aquatilis]GGD47662.1 hypothetical protein GCM10011514_09560 [Emticicia aquatilis]
MNTSLFSEFPKITKNDWIAQVTKDLKGKNFEETLVWQTLENFEVQPYYSEEDLQNLPIANIQAAQKNKNSGSWQNRAYIKYNTEKEVNVLIINYLQRGVSAVVIDFGKTDVEKVDWAKLLNNVKLSDNPVFFKTPYREQALEQLTKIVHYLPKGGFQVDVLAELFLNDEPTLSNYTWENTKQILSKTLQFPQFSAFTVESHVFHNSGANTVQELAFILASAVEYVDKLTDLGLTPEQVISKFEFSISIGTNYFMEVAKLRALRYLWSKVLEAYNCASLIKDCQIHCQTSSFYNSTLSPYTNMLRATTEAMSAVMGGCDSLTISAYDAVLNNELSSDFGERIAQNMAILMKEEAHLDKTIDPSAGSYYIENLTYQLATEAWNLFQKVESLGGITAAFEQGFVQEEVNKSYEANVNRLKGGKVMVGVNKFRIEPENTLPKTEKVNTNKLQNRRLSEVFE